MAGRFRNNGFTLTEVLMAAGILAIGFMFVAGTFPVGVKLSSMATEQTIGGIVANEAFAKIKLYGGIGIPSEEFRYPSTDTGAETKKYGWSFLPIPRGDGSFSFIVFVSRKTNAAAKYPYRAVASNPWNLFGWPWPISIRFIQPDPGSVSEIVIDPADEALAKYVSKDSVLISIKEVDLVIQKMVVRKREPVDDTDTDYRKVLLVRSVNGDMLGNKFWVIPPAVGALTDPAVPPPVTGRNPFVGVYY